MVKDFDTWNEVKKVVDEKERIIQDFYFHEREVWWSTLGLNIGVESDGKGSDFERPILIIKKFNAHMLWMVSLTGKSYDDLYHVKINHGSGVSWACLTQFRTISTKRLLRKVWRISKEEMDQVIDGVIRNLKNETPTKCGGISEPEGTNTSSINDSKLASS